MVLWWIKNQPKMGDFSCAMLVAISPPKCAEVMMQSVPSTALSINSDGELQTLKQVKYTSRRKAKNTWNWSPLFFFFFLVFSCNWVLVASKRILAFQTQLNLWLWRWLSQFHHRLSWLVERVHPPSCCWRPPSVSLFCPGFQSAWVFEYGFVLYF